GLDRGRRLRRQPRHDPAHHRPGRRPLRQIPHRHGDVRVRLDPGRTVRHGAIALRARARALRVGRRRRLDHSALHGLCRRRDALRAPPTGARPLSLGADFRPALRAGGVLGQLLGWRGVFFVLAGMFALATLGLVFELLTNPRTRAAGHGEETSRGFVADYVAVLSNPWARFVILAVFIEASIGWGAFAYVGADLHLRFSLTFSAIGLIVGTFGIGGLLYAASVQQLVNRFGQAGLAIFGGVLLGLAYLTLAFSAVWWLTPIAVTAIGLGF